jgi:hypothetical protein
VIGGLEKSFGGQSLSTSQVAKTALADALESARSTSTRLRVRQSR